MKANEIIKTVAMFNTIMAAVLECEKINKKAGYMEDNAFVMCKGVDAYFNEFLDVMNGDKYQSCKNLSEAVAVYTEICLNAGAVASDVYIGY